MSQIIFRRLVGLMLGLAMFAIAAVPQPAYAAGPWYVAPTGSDDNNCLSPATPCGTINNAISLATAGDTILVATGTYTGSSGEVVLMDKDINLSGGWDETFTLQNDMSTIDGQSVRRGIVVNSGITAVLERFIVQNGMDGVGVPIGEGGGIRNEGTLTVNNSSISNNAATGNVSHGGGIYNEGSGILTLNDSMLGGNTAIEGQGGGLYNNSGGVVTFNHSAVSGNAADRDAGGILNNFGTVIMNNSTVSDNTTVNFGGGIFSTGDLIINDSILSGNTVSPPNGNGAAIRNHGTLTMSQSAVDGNTAGWHSGGIYNGGTATIDHSAITHNSASVAGGIWNDGGTLNLSNSTISHNKSTANGGGLVNSSNAVAEVRSSTISSNRAMEDGGGLFTVATMNLENTLVSNNTAGGSSPDCFGSINSLGHNLIGNTSSCTFSPGTGDKTDLDPNLGLLMGPAGFPGYHPLLVGSPAIDAGNPGGCTDHEGNPLTTDQRGVARVGTCDIGAYEFTISGPAVSLSIAGGNNQNGIANLAFPLPLQAAALDSQGSPVGGVTIDFTAPGSGASGTFTQTGSNTTSASTDSGGVATTSTFTANNQAGAYIVTASAAGLGSVDFHLEQVAGPSNDSFAGASVVTALPFDDAVDTTAATMETGEPTPSCVFGNLSGSIWYTFTPSTSGSVSANAFNINGFATLVAAYAGNSLANLTELGCQTFAFNLVTFHVDAGNTYYIQVGVLGTGLGGLTQFHIEVTPPPVADFFFFPNPPSVFDATQFIDNSVDPGQVDFQTFTWNFGDGAISTEANPTHQYANDGDFIVEHSVTTLDGRSASTSQLVEVRTHDVSITKIAAPKSASSGQTKAITVSIRNTRYPETVRVDLYKSTPAGNVWISSVTLQVPVSAGNKTRQFNFNYTFTAEDAQIGKVSFRAEAFIEGANDAFPQDNTAISSPPTKVGR